MKADDVVIYFVYNFFISGMYASFKNTTRILDSRC